MNLLFDGLSDTGKVRKRNEDSIRLESDVRLVIVADGMGGYGGGDVASRIACEVVTDAVRAGYQAVDAFREALDEGSPFGRAVQEARLSVMKLLSDAAIEADSCIQRAAADDAATGSEELVGMGSTVVMALFVADRAFVAHVGDSRAYLLRQGVPVRLTSDHSLLQGLVDGGMISQADVARFPMKNVLTRALGVPGTVLPDVIELELAAGDRVLLCSDGLYGLVRDDMIGRLGGTGDLGRCTSKLVAYANAAGGTDNISVVIVEITATDDPGTGRRCRQCPGPDSAQHTRKVDFSGAFNGRMAEAVFVFAQAVLRGRRNHLFRGTAWRWNVLRASGGCRYHTRRSFRPCFRFWHHLERNVPDRGKDSSCQRGGKGRDHGDASFTHRFSCIMRSVAGYREQVASPASGPDGGQPSRHPGRT